MARQVTPLSKTKVRTAKTQDKDYKLFDGGGLFLLVTHSNSKLWRLKYRFDGKEKLLALGSYPEISLSKARTIREENNKHLHTFKAIALQRLELLKNDISDTHYKGTLRGFVNDTFPYIGNMDINEITAKDIIVLLRRMMERNVRNSTQKVYQQIGKTFKWAVANGLAERNPAVNGGVKISILLKSKVILTNL